MLLLPQVASQGQPPSQRPGTHAQTISPLFATAVVDPIAGKRVFKPETGIQKSNRRAAEDAYSVKARSANRQPVGYHFALVCMLARTHSMHIFVAPHSTTQHSTTQHSTAQHSTTQHSTAQHSTAQHGTARHSSARHRTGPHIWHSKPTS